MNYVQIQKMLQDIKTDYIEMGRPWTEFDGNVRNLIMRMYLETPELDWEEVKWLFVNYLKIGELNFSAAIKMARKRIHMGGKK